MDDRFAFAYMFRRHQQISAQIDRDPVFAIRQNVDESDARICTWQSVDEVGRYALVSIELQGAFAEDIVADAREQMYVRSQSCRANCLIAALATGTHIERVASQAFAQRGYTRHADRQSFVVAADYKDSGHEDLPAFTCEFASTF